MVFRTRSVRLSGNHNLRNGCNIPPAIPSEKPNGPIERLSLHGTGGGIYVRSSPRAFPSPPENEWPPALAMSLLQTLRNATHAIHRQLDEVVPLESVTRSRRDHTAYLERFHLGLSQCWPVLDWDQLGRLGLPDLAARKARYHSLALDLAELGIPVPPLAKSATPVDAAQSVGCLYVLEGSLHGGRQILAELERRTGLLPAGQARFLRAFGERNDTAWRDFVSWLSSIEASPTFEEAASRSAVKAFDHFLAALNPGCVAGHADPR